MKFEIRNARPDELDRLAAIMLAAWQQGIAPLVPGPAPVVGIGAPTLPRTTSALLVATVAGEPVGLAAADVGNAYVSDLWVEPACQGRGVGSALLAALEARIAATGRRIVQLEVLSANVRAMALYRYRGYRPVWEGLKLDRGLGLPLHKTGMRKRLVPRPTRP